MKPTPPDETKWTAYEVTVRKDYLNAVGRELLRYGLSEREIRTLMLSNREFVRNGYGASIPELVAAALAAQASDRGVG